MFKTNLLLKHIVVILSVFIGFTFFSQSYSFAKKDTHKAYLNSCIEFVKSQGFTKIKPLCKCMVSKATKKFSAETLIQKDFFKQVVLGDYPSHPKEPEDEHGGHDPYEDEYEKGIDIAEACIKKTKAKKGGKK